MVSEQSWPLQPALCETEGLPGKVRVRAGSCRLGSSRGGSGGRLEAGGMGLLLHSGVAHMVPTGAQAGAAAG